LRPGVVTEAWRSDMTAAVVRLRAPPRIAEVRATPRWQGGTVMTTRRLKRPTRICSGVVV
jgi:hypothetical protein